MMRLLRIPQPYAFWRNCGQKWSLGHFVIHWTTIDHFRYLWRHFKKIEKIGNFAIIGFWVFFREKTIVIIISIGYASKWWVTWPLTHNDLENDQFGHFIRIFIGTSGLMIRWSQKQYFCNECNKCFNLRCHSVGLSPLFLFRIITVRDWKMFLVVSRDLSTDKQNKTHKCLRKSTGSDKSH